MRTPFEGFESAVCSGVPLAAMTSFGLGGPAEHFIQPRSLEQAAGLASCCRDCGIPFRVLGGGTNILVSDRGLSGAAFTLSKMTHISRSGSRVICEAGAPLPRLVRRAEHWGLSGLEHLAGIPGTVGGAVATNASGKYGSITSPLRSVTTLDRHGSVHRRTPDKLGLGYHRSELRGEVVLRAEFDLTEKDPVEIAETRMSVLKEKTQTQPLAALSAGCIFKNPDGCAAGELIDLAGLKGERVGRAVVSDRHANFIINEGGATTCDVRALIDTIKERVRKAFGINLELEIELWN